MNKSAKSSKSPKSPKSSKSSKENEEEAARVAEIAWGMAYMNQLWKNAYKKAGEEINANLKKG
jgi:hypothetical protein